MKKLDKLILSSFIGPFILTFLVVVFILLTQHMLKYFDDIIGKGLGLDVIGQLLFYFAIFMTPIALPLAVLLSSLIAFGNLGEHFELTAIKSAGISLTRTILPIFFFVILLTIAAFYVNNNLVPKAALEAYSLLYDIKQKKPALDLREGSFYDGIPDLSIKVNKKFSDGVTLKDIIIYDHRKHDGNKDVTIADSGKMYTIMNERYLKLELFDGYNFKEGASSEQQVAGRKGKDQSETMSRTEFSKTQVVFDLASFDLERTDKKWFQGNRIMRNLGELENDIDSIDQDLLQTRLSLYTSSRGFFSYYLVKDSIVLPDDLFQFKSRNDSSSVISQELREQNTQTYVTPPVDSLSLKVETPIVMDTSEKVRDKTLRKNSNIPRRSAANKRVVSESKAALVIPTKITYDGVLLNKSKTVWSDSARNGKVDSILRLPPSRMTYEGAASKARSAKNQLLTTLVSIEDFNKDQTVFRIQWHKILASSFACIAMFLIGAPLGAIIKKGGLGVPFLVSIMFFIIYYLLTMTGEKWAKQGIVGVPVGVWAADIILFGVGMLFLRQARLDARLFEADFYSVVFDKFHKWLVQRRILPASTVK